MPFHIDIQEFGFRLVALIIAISIHEFAHAFTALRLGDDTAQRQGRITLNPVSHFDPFGFFMLLIMSAIGFGFAWGRPVPVNTYALKGGRRGMSLVAIAGPLSNLVQAAIAVAIMNLLAANSVADSNVFFFVKIFVEMNLLLATFNLLPIPPLDGFNVLMGIVSDFWVQRLAPLYQGGAFILLIVVFVGGSYTYQYAIYPVANLFGHLIGYI